jgi:hypothetical protein
LKVKTSILKPAFTILAVCALIIATLPSAAFAQDVQIISGSPGDTLSLSGTGAPNSQVSLEVSASIGVGTTLSGDKYYYKSTMSGLHIPGGNSLSITVSPVDTLTVSGSFPGVPIGMSMDGSVSNHVGTFSRSVPAGTYNIVVSGIANGSPSSVSMTVRASQPQSVGSDGKFTASISTSGLPSTVYTVTQDGNTVAMVYLGVQAPATPTPTQVPSPSPVPTNVPGVNGSLNGTGNTSTILPSPCVEPGLNSTNATPVSSAGPSQPSPNSGLGSWAVYLILIVLGTIVGIAAAYLFVVKKH